MNEATGIFLRAARVRCAVMGLLCLSGMATAQSIEQMSDEQKRNAAAQFHQAFSAPEEAFRLVGNIYYVGAKNISSYLITTPQGHILIDTGTNEMGPVIKANVAKLGFKLSDIKIMLSSHGKR